MWSRVKQGQLLRKGAIVTFIFSAVCLFVLLQLTCVTLLSDTLYGSYVIQNEGKEAGCLSKADLFLKFSWTKGEHVNNSPVWIADPWVSGWLSHEPVLSGIRVLRNHFYAINIWSFPSRRWVIAADSFQTCNYYSDSLSIVLLHSYWWVLGLPALLSLPVSDSGQTKCSAALCFS
jgi:hypothetical protein